MLIYIENSKESGLTLYCILKIYFKKIKNDNLYNWLQGFW